MKQGEQKSMQRDLRTVSVSSIVVSLFNGRTTRPDADITKLAERMRRNGFEATRAPWVVQAGDTFEVFAGATRVAAARIAGIETIPVFVFSGVSDDEIARLADEDNENDEYHTKVPIVDVWAEYARLKSLGWTGRRIGEAKRKHEDAVTLGIRLHGSHESLKKAVRDEDFGEDHAKAVYEAVRDVPESLSPWLTEATATKDLVDEVLGKHRGSKAGVKPTVAVVREAARRWKAMISAAEVALAQFEPPYAEQFVAKLAESKARSEAAVTQAAASIKKQQAEDAKEEAKKKQDEANKATDEEKRKREEAEAAEERAALLACLLNGDAKAAASKCPEGAKLILTDPPYGMAFQSGRRTNTPKKKQIEADESPEAAIGLLRSVLPSLIERADRVAHFLVFTQWRHEPEFRSLLTELGLMVRGSLIWVKNNHGGGDLKAFAPKHERILHATKGDAEIAPRIPDVLFGKDQQNSKHPTEKPRDLLGQLIEVCTQQGDLVIDPFFGSGNTLLEAHAMGRRFWGCELDAEYHRDASDALLRQIQVVK